MRLLRRGEQTKQLEMLVTVLPDTNSEQLLFVTEQYERCDD
jgi:hypothetical protein